MGWLVACFVFGREEKCSQIFGQKMWSKQIEDMCLYGRIMVEIDLKSNLDAKQVGSGGKG
jgi:hypothetical protein